MGQESACLRQCLKMAQTINNIELCHQIKSMIAGIERTERLPDMMSRLSKEQKNIVQTANLILMNLYENPQPQHQSQNVVGKITPVQRPAPSTFIPMPFSPKGIGK